MDWKAIKKKFMGGNKYFPSKSELNVAGNYFKEIILRYVKEDTANPYALMITGDWGCGKTYFLKEILSKEIEKDTDKKILYISLNGIKLLKEVSEQLFFESFEISSHKSKNVEAIKKLTKLGKIGGKVISRWLKIDEEDLKEIRLKDLINFSDSVIIFDDLERLSEGLPPSEMLGFINTHFIEHNKIKVLIICNEQEIANGKKQ